MRILPITLLAIAALGFSAAHAADVYRWTDAQGVTHYADTPPEGLKYERVNVRGGTTAAAPEAAATDAATKPATAAAGAQVDANLRAELCRTARRNMETLDSGAAVSMVVNGETRNLSDEEIKAQRADNQRTIEANCD